MFITRVAVSIVVYKTNKKLTQYKLSFLERSQVIGQFYLHQAYKTNKKLTQYKLSFLERSQVIGQFYLHQAT